MKASRTPLILALAACGVLLSSQALAKASSAAPSYSGTFVGPPNGNFTYTITNCLVSTGLHACIMAAQSSGGGTLSSYATSHSLSNVLINTAQANGINIQVGGKTVATYQLGPNGSSNNLYSTPVTATASTPFTWPILTLAPSTVKNPTTVSNGSITLSDGASLSFSSNGAKVGSIQTMLSAPTAASTSFTIPNTLNIKQNGNSYNIQSQSPAGNYTQISCASGSVSNCLPSLSTTKQSASALQANVSLYLNNSYIQGNNVSTTSSDDFVVYKPTVGNISGNYQFTQGKAKFSYTLSSNANCGGKALNNCAAYLQPNPDMFTKQKGDYFITTNNVTINGQSLSITGYSKKGTFASLFKNPTLTHFQIGGSITYSKLVTLPNGKTLTNTVTTSFPQNGNNQVEPTLSSLSATELAPPSNLSMAYPATSASPSDDFTQMKAQVSYEITSGQQKGTVISQNITGGYYKNSVGIAKALQKPNMKLISVSNVQINSFINIKNAYATPTGYSCGLSIGQTSCSRSAVFKAPPPTSSTLIYKKPATAALKSTGAKTAQPIAASTKVLQTGL